MNFDISKGKYSIKRNAEGKFEISPELKEIMINSAQMSGGISSVGSKAAKIASKLAQLSNKEKLFYTQGRDATKRMADKKIWDKLMFERAKLLNQLK